MLQNSTSLSPYSDPTWLAETTNRLDEGKHRVKNSSFFASSKETGTPRVEAAENDIVNNDTCSAFSQERIRGSEDGNNPANNPMKDLNIKKEIPNLDYALPDNVLSTMKTAISFKNSVNDKFLEARHAANGATALYTEHGLLDGCEEPVRRVVSGKIRPMRCEEEGPEGRAELTAIYLLVIQLVRVIEALLALLLVMVFEKFPERKHKDTSSKTHDPSLTTARSRHAPNNPRENPPGMCAVEMPTSQENSTKGRHPQLEAVPPEDVNEETKVWQRDGYEWDSPRSDGDGDERDSPRSDGDGDERDSPRSDGDGYEWDSPRSDGDGYEWDSPRSDGDGDEWDSPRSDGDGDEWDSPRIDGDGDEWDSPRIDGDGDEWDSPRSDGDGYEWDSPRSDGDGYGWDSPRSDGDGDEWDSPRSDGDGYGWDSPRSDGDEDGRNGPCNDGDNDGRQTSQGRDSTGQHGQKESGQGSNQNHGGEGAGGGHSGSCGDGEEDDDEDDKRRRDSKAKDADAEVDEVEENQESDSDTVEGDIPPQADEAQTSVQASSAPQPLAVCPTNQDLSLIYQTITECQIQLHLTSQTNASHQGRSVCYALGVRANRQLVIWWQTVSLQVSSSSVTLCHEAFSLRFHNDSVTLHRSMLILTLQNNTITMNHGMLLWRLGEDVAVRYLTQVRIDGVQNQISCADFRTLGLPVTATLTCEGLSPNTSLRLCRDPGAAMPTLPAGFTGRDDPLQMTESQADTEEGNGDSSPVCALQSESGGRGGTSTTGTSLELSPGSRGDSRQEEAQPGVWEESRREASAGSCREEDSRNQPANPNDEDGDTEGLGLPIQCTDDIQTTAAPRESSVQAVQDDMLENDVGAEGGDVANPSPGSGMPVHMQLRSHFTFCGTPEQDRREERVRQLRHERQRLMQPYLCHCCMEEMFEKVLIPCHHMVCCPCYYAFLPRCPCCPEQVISTVPILFN